MGYDELVKMPRKCGPIFLQFKNISKYLLVSREHTRPMGLCAVVSSREILLTKFTGRSWVRLYSQFSYRRVNIILCLRKSSRGEKLCVYRVCMFPAKKDARGVVARIGK